MSDVKTAHLGIVAANVFQDISMTAYILQDRLLSVQSKNNGLLCIVLYQVYFDIII